MKDVTLTGEQKKVLVLPVEHPVLIKGAAGSGKTTVAVYRARYLMETQRDLFRPTRGAVYQATARAGRGTADRVTAQDKELLWAVFEAYNAGLAARNRIDWDDAILRALEIAERPSFTPPFTHIVVDEAQDLTFAQLALISRLVSPEMHSITLVADSAQRIYQSGFSWSDTGLNVRGRSFEFRHNYRNTRQIADAAGSLLGKKLVRVVHAAKYTQATRRF